MQKVIARYFEQTRRYSLRRFIIEMALIPFPLKLLLGIVYASIFGEITQSTTDAIAGSGVPMLLVAALIVGPALETLIGQWLPIWVAWKITRNPLIIVAASAIFFSLQHLHVGLVGIATALPPGIFLAWAWLVMRGHSRWRAYWVTTVIHAAHNAVALLFYAGLQ